MSRRVRFAAACLLAGLLSGGLLAAPAVADDTPSPSPVPSTSGSPVPILPSPSPSATSVAAVTDLHAGLGSGDALVVTWQAASGDTGFTAAATAEGRTELVETGATTASFTRIPAGARVLIDVTAHGAGGDAAPTRTAFTMPAAVAPVGGAAMHAVAAGLEVTWHRPALQAPGTRFLVELAGADGSHRSRLVAGTSVTFTGLTLGRLYSATVTAVAGTGRSPAVDVAPAVWSRPAAMPQGGAAPAPATVAASPSSGTASAIARPDAAQPTAQRTVVSSPLAAAALAAAAVLLGGLAIGLLLKRPRRS